MRYLIFRRRTIAVLMLLILVLLSLETDAKELKILMFLWNRETKAEEGFRDVLEKEFPDQDLVIPYSLLSRMWIVWNL